MRKILLILSIILSINFTANSQSRKERKANELNVQEAIAEKYKNSFTVLDDKSIQFIKIIDVPGQNQATLFMSALEAMALAYNDSREVIKSQDKDTGVIFGDGIVIAYDNTTGWGVRTYIKCPQTIKIQVKDEKARIIITTKEYNYTISGGGISNNVNINITAKYPFWEECEDKWKAEQLSHFNGLCMAVNSLISSIENKLKNSQNTDEW